MVDCNKFADSLWLQLRTCCKNERVIYFTRAHVFNYQNRYFFLVGLAAHALLR